MGKAQEKEIVNTHLVLLVSVYSILVVSCMYRW